MEKRTKHRILGVIVVVGIVIISLPLFQGLGYDNGAKLLTAPSFPDQSVQVDATQPTETPTTTSTVQTSPIPLKDPSKDTGINQLPDDTISPLSTPATPAQAPAMSPPNNAAPLPNPNNSDTGSDNEAIPPTSDAGSKAETVAIKPTETITTTKVKPVVALKKPLHPTSNDVNGLFKLKEPVWVIQLGSFKNKENALRLVNQLRMKGYPAFIQQTDARTRVFVGPEYKEKNARTVAIQLAQEMHINGMVVSYKPLAL